MQTHEELYDIIRQAFERGNYLISDHAFERMYERKIDSFEIRDSVLSGTVLETREVQVELTDKPVLETMVLVYGQTRAARKLHVCIAIRHKQKQLVVTVYEPDLDSWKLGFTIRRRGEG
jgi:hypothetical protein